MSEGRRRSLGELAQVVTRGWRAFTGQREEDAGGGLESFPFAPGQPVEPIGTVEEQREGPRGYDYAPGYNISYMPRREEASTGGVTFEDMRQFALTYDIARICIAARIDEMVGLKTIITARVPAESDRYTNEIAQAMAFFESPDKEHTWEAWLGMALEEVFVTDALAIYPQMDRAGRLHALQLVDGTTIKPLLDVRGRTPAPPAPAYQQVIKGAPRSWYTRDQIIYRPKNGRVYTPYGFSAIEWVLMTMSLAMRKQLWDLAWFTEGVTPEGFLRWSPGAKLPPREQLNQWLADLDIAFAGNDAQRRKLKPLPPDSDFVAVRPYVFSKDLDEFRAKVTCAAFGVAPQEIGFTTDVNKATASAQESVQYRRSIRPLAQYVSGLINLILARYLGMPYLKHEFQIGEAEDVAEAETWKQNAVKLGLLSIDEWRDEHGYMPLGVGPAIITEHGAIPLTEAFAGTAQREGVTTPAGVAETAAEGVPSFGFQVPSSEVGEQDTIATKRQLLFQDSGRVREEMGRGLNLEGWQERSAALHRARLEDEWRRRGNRFLGGGDDRRRG